MSDNKRIALTVDHYKDHKMNYLRAALLALIGWAVPVILSGAFPPHEVPPAPPVQVICERCLIYVNATGH